MAFLVFGGVVYLLYNLVFAYLGLFLLEIGVPKTVNSGAVVPVAEALAVNLAAIALFGLLHSLMARDGVKRVWTRVVPQAAERSVYVLQSVLCLALIVWVWRPMPTVIWSFDGWLAWIFYAGFALGAVVAASATHLIDHYELFGLRQVWLHSRGETMPAPVFKTPGLYRYMRHPMQSGTILLMFATPHMTVGHMLLAVSMTLYVLIGLRFEERALERQFGEAYRRYQAQVPRLVPSLRRRAS